MAACAATYAGGRSWDEESQTPFTGYVRDGGNYQLWCDDVESFDRKLARTQDLDIAGIGIWALGYETPEWWEKIRERFVPDDPTDGGVDVDAGIDLDAGAPDAGAGNQPPVAVVVPPRTPVPGEEATIDGSGSFDPEGAPLLFRWTQDSGPPTSLVIGTDAVSFTPGEPGTYVFSLVVSDGERASQPATVLVEVVAQEAGGGGDAGGCGCTSSPGAAAAMVLLAWVVRRRRGAALGK